MSDDQPTLPYGGVGDPNSGYSGSDTSAERAHRDDANGTTHARQRQALDMLGTAGHSGLTWKEFATVSNLHHGQASGALSNLHKGGQISRLTVRRDRCKVYVLPTYVDDRATEPPAGWRRDRWFERALPLLARLSSCPDHEEPVGDCQRCSDAVDAFRLIREYQREVQSR